MNIGVTGAGGYIGSRLVSALRAGGHNVVALGRRPLTSQVAEWRHYDLEKPLDKHVLEGLEAVVHCAWDMRVHSRTLIERINVRGVQRLAEAANSTGTQIFLASSMSASPGTEQLYGQAKLRCEEVVGEAGGYSIRLGLVYGEVPGGMFGALCRLARLSVIPLIGARSHQFLVHENDMVAGMMAVMAHAEVPQPLGLAHPDPVPFKALMEDLSRRQGHRFRAIPLPWSPVYRSMSLAEAVGLSLPVRADSVLGLARPAAVVPNYEFWQGLRVGLRPYQFCAGPAPEG
jgi:nucleoside-diphosphate-sugar epimerase